MYQDHLNKREQLSWAQTSFSSELKGDWRAITGFGEGRKLAQYPLSALRRLDRGQSLRQA